MKKILLVLLSFLLLSSCASEKEISIEESNLVALSKFEVREKTTSQKENEDFNDFLADFNLESLKRMDFVGSSSFIYNPDNFDMSEKEGGLEPLVYGFDEEEYTFYNNYLKKLESFDYDTLSSYQQYQYESLKYSIYETLTMIENYRYDLVFSKRNDVIVNLFFTLADISLNTENRIIAYLETIASLDTYLNSLIEYTKQQYAEGIYTGDEALDYTANMISNILAKGDENSLILTFSNRIAKTEGLLQEDKEKYLAQNYDLVMNDLFPYLRKMLDELESLKGKKQTYVSECDKEYKDMLYAINSSSNASLSDILNLLIDTYNDFLQKYEEALENPDYEKRLEQYYADPLFKLEEKEMIRTIYELGEGFYPRIKEIKFEINEFDDSLKDTNILAYYRIYQFDNTDNNIIMVNPSTKQTSTPYDYGATITHEGIFGHMYIYNYYAQKGIEENALLINYSAYDEGMAMYSEYLLPLIMGYEDVSAIISYDYIGAYLIDSIFDIMINYFDYDSKYMKDNFGLSQSQYEYYLQYPALLIRYGVGFAYIYQYLNMTKEALGDDFSYEEFNELLMCDGPLPFVILENKIKEYILNN